VPTIGIRELSRDISEVIAEVERTGRPVLVTRDGQPVVVLYAIDYAIDADDLEDFVLSHAPEFVRDRAEAKDALRRGETQSLDAVLRELGDEAP